MMRLLLALTALLPLLLACSSQPDPREPFEVPLSLEIDTEVNPYGDTGSHPVVLRLYQLTEAGSFESADFLDLYQADRQSLAGALVDVSYLQPLRPGTAKQMQIDVHRQAKYLAVMAEFADYTRASSKGVIKLGQDPERELLIIRVTGLSVSLDKQSKRSRWWLF